MNPINTRTHTHTQTHTQKERERERYVDVAVLCAVVSVLFSPPRCFAFCSKRFRPVVAARAAAEKKKMARPPGSTIHSQGIFRIGTAFTVVGLGSRAAAARVGRCHSATRQKRPAKWPSFFLVFWFFFSPNGFCFVPDGGACGHRRRNGGVFFFFSPSFAFCRPRRNPPPSLSPSSRLRRVA